MLGQLCKSFLYFLHNLEDKINAKSFTKDTLHLQLKRSGTIFDCLNIAFKSVNY